MPLTGQRWIPKDRTNVALEQRAEKELSCKQNNQKGNNQNNKKIRRYQRINPYRYFIVPYFHRSNSFFPFTEAKLFHH